MQQEKIMKIVITGASGSGKTAVIEELSKLGHAVLTESARELIIHKMEKGSNHLPWADWCAFQLKLMDIQLKREAGIKTLTFLDRGIIDEVPYFWVNGAEPPPELVKVCSEAGYAMVFFLETLPEYKTDSERWEDFETIQKLAELTERAYREFGYEPVKVPVLPPAERARFILEKVGASRT